MAFSNRRVASMRVRCARSAALVFALAATREASATPTFPSVIAAELALPSSPECSLCHEGPQQRGTVTTPFGTSMRSRGLISYDESSLRTALSALDAEKKDSDEDGTPDIAELRAGTSPNVSAAGASADSVPDYGCHTAVSAPADATMLLAWVACLTRRRVLRKAREDRGPHRR